MQQCTIESVFSSMAYFFRKAFLNNDGTTHNGTRPPIRAAGSHHLKRLVYGGFGLGLTLSEVSEGLVGSEWPLVGIGAIKELISVRSIAAIDPVTIMSLWTVCTNSTTL